MVKSIKKAVILVVGLGARMLFESKTISMQLTGGYEVPINEDWVKEDVVAGITDMITDAYKFKGSIVKFFDAYYELTHKVSKKGKEPILGIARTLFLRGLR